MMPSLRGRLCQQQPHQWPLHPCSIVPALRLHELPAAHFRQPSWRQHSRSKHQHAPHVPHSADAAAGGVFDSGGEQPEERTYTPFPRARERDPYRLLGLGKDASFEEIQDARNYLYEQYRWHEPSRESIELAFDSLIQEKMKLRHKQGFRPPRTGKRGEARGDFNRTTIRRRIENLFDPTVTTRTLINEGAVYGLLAAWSVFSTDQSFPLAGTFAYSVYKFQSRRMKLNPEGPHFGGSPIIGALITTVLNLAFACALMAGLTAPLAPLLGPSIRQVGAGLVVLVVGLLGVYLK